MASLLAVDDRRQAAPRSWLKLLGLALLLGAVPLLGDDYLGYQIGLFLIYGVATQAVALCWGRLGFLPLGHALYFGLGAYLAGGILKSGIGGTVLLSLAWLTPLLLLPAIVLPALLAWLVARLVFVRSVGSGAYFSLVTLAMTMLGYLIALQASDLTGGFNGLGNIPELPGFDRFGGLYALIAVFALASTALLMALDRRPIGLLWQAVADNENRLQFFGYATHRLKAQAYALSAALTAAAGVLFALHQGMVSPQAMSFVLSTEFVIWAAVGGKASALGALFGAVLIGYATAELRDRIASWEVLIALTFIAVVRYLPDGLAGLFAGLWQRWATRRPQPTRPVAALGSSWAPPVSGPTGEVSLTFDAVACQQGPVRILDGLSLQLDGPGIRAVIGPNGAGKTSSFNAMTGRLPVRRGHVGIDGQDVTNAPAWQMARRGIGRKMQVPSVFERLTVQENLLIALWAARLRRQDMVRFNPFGWRTPLLEEMLARFPDLAARQDQRAGRLAQGHRQALELLMTLLPEPRLLLLDEPCAGLSPDETRRMTAAIMAGVESLGAAALLIEHDLAAVQALRGEVLVLHQGRLLARGPLADVQRDPAVRAVYAGARK